MIIKNYETNKIDLKKFKYFLLYGNNKGHIDEIINNFFDQILNNSFFENEKIIIISRISEKSKKIIEEIQEKKVDDVIFIFKSGTLEKKSKLRKFFEEDKNSICIAFYPDTSVTLNKIANEFFKKKNISISQSNINLIIQKSNADRENLNNELKKIELFSLSSKNISTENIIKLVNLNENHSIFDLVDNCLLKNQKKVINIINENNFSVEDSIIILRTFLNKSKKLLNLSKEYEKNNNINQTISNAKPPIFWKEKEIVKKQITNWGSDEIKKLIVKISEIELQIKKNSYNPINVTLDFIFDQSSQN
jgi:DNA polymerase-3 subunit delta